MDYDKTNDIRTHAVCNIALQRMLYCCSNTQNKNSKQRNKGINACNILKSTPNHTQHLITTNRQNIRRKYDKKIDIIFNAQQKNCQHNLCSQFTLVFRLTSFQNFSVFPRISKQERKIVTVKKTRH